MSRNQRLRPLQPIFDTEKLTGSIQVGNTPPAPITPPGSWYDSNILDSIRALLFYPVRSTDPMSYDWSPYTYAVVKDGDLATEANEGRIWFDAWWAEHASTAGTPADYDSQLADLGLMLTFQDALLDDTVPPQATGAVTTWDADGYRYHRWTGSGAFWQGAISGAPYPIYVDGIVVGGGGGGGSRQSGGGGGGGEVAVLSAFAVSDIEMVSVGNGGAGAGTGSAGQGADGEPSSFGSTIALGGGGGGAVLSNNALSTGRDGGSGGGAGAATPGWPGGTGSSGGNGGASFGLAGTGAGGGGAGGNGQDQGLVAPGVGGQGGAGIEWPSGSGVYYGGGGGGAQGAGGQHGGGNGSSGTSAGQNGTANTGGGGGGGGRNAWSGGISNLSGGAGGSGVVIIRYPWPL